MPHTRFQLIQTHFKSVDPIVAKTLTTVSLEDWLEKRVVGDYFQALCRDIIYQQLAGKAAATIYSRFETLIGNSVTPEQVANQSDQQLRDVGLSWAKARYVKDLADKVLAKEVKLSKLDSLSDQQVISELTKVKGIGLWTAEMFLLFTLHREDIFSYGDLGLRKGFSSLYHISDPSDEQISEVVTRWSPYRSYGSIALWHHLDNNKT